MVWGYGKTYCGINLMIQRVCMTLIPQKEVSKDPWMLLHAFIASFDNNGTRYILYISLKLGGL